MFQSTPPRGGRRSPWAPPRAGASFNPRPRVGGDLPPVQARSHQERFNPRPRVGGDCNSTRIKIMPEIVSIHAPAWGATRPNRGGAGLDSRFQSTPPRGGRHEWGQWQVVAQGFQSTPPRGGRPVSVLVTRGDGLFQSTPPRGGRHKNTPISAQKQPVSIHAPAWGATSLWSPPWER